LQPSTPATIAQCEARLQPCGQKTGTAELMACLTLVAPSGMTAADRQAWVAVARQTLSGIPADLMQAGCRHARETCRFASEVVPAILDRVGPEWRRRKRVLAEERSLMMERLAAPEYAPIPEDECARILREAREAVALKKGDA
jgi:hypothetical protein